MWHYYLKQGSRERNHGNEAFHKLVTMCTMAHVLYKRSLNQNPTIYSAVDSVCNILFNISKYFPTSQLTFAISKKEEISNLLSSGYSPHLFARSILADIYIQNKPQIILHLLYKLQGTVANIVKDRS